MVAVKSALARMRGQDALAEQQYRSALDEAEHMVLPPERCLETLKKLTDACFAQRRMEEALELCRRALILVQQSHPTALHILKRL